MTPSRFTVRLLWAAVIFLVLIGVGAVARRAVVLIAGPAQVQTPARGPATLDAEFARHPTLTMVHIVPGLVFMLLGPWQFVKRLRVRRPRLHRWSGRVFVGAGLVIGTSALAMSVQMSIGGVNESAATMFFAVWFLIALTQGFVHIRRREFALHREWMIRAFAIGLAIATIRPIIGIFFATSPLSHLTPHDFFGIAFWIGFTLHLIAAEVWINYTRPHLRARAAQA